MNIEVNDWVTRVSYPMLREDFPQTYEHVKPCTSNRVVALDASRESITLSVYCDGKYYVEEFWAGNFRKVTLSPILAGDQ